MNTLTYILGVYLLYTTKLYNLRQRRPYFEQMKIILKYPAVYMHVYSMHTKHMYMSTWIY
nr:MAG TPA: hypothetical protein [Caudoviricetes sp.]